MGLQKLPLQIWDYYCTNHTAKIVEIEENTESCFSSLWTGCRVGEASERNKSHRQITLTLLFLRKAPKCGQNVALDNSGKTSPISELLPFSTMPAPLSDCHCHEPSRQQWNPMLLQTKTRHLADLDTRQVPHGPSVAPLNYVMREPCHTTKATHGASMVNLPR